MVPASAATLLSRARAFIDRNAGKAALAVVPLAVIALATPAKGQVVFNPPSSSGASAFANGFAHASGNAFFSRALTASNGITGVVLGGSATFVGHGPGEAGVGIEFFGGGSGTFASNFPIAYDFTLGTTGSATISSWSLELTTSYTIDLSSTTQTIASGETAGQFSGSYTFNPEFAPLGGYHLKLTVAYNTAEFDTLSITMNDGAMQGVMLNATAIPEPATYAAWVGAAAVLAAVRRRTLRRSFAV
jgi:hypothetical protein